MSPAKPSNSENRTCWGIVPAAGIGKRMQSEVPKQYLTIEGRSVLEHSLLNLCEVPALSGIVVCIHARDSHWSKLSIRHSKLLGTVTGGETRAESVMNGVRFLRQRGNPEDWVVVHDAVRPCVGPESIQGLIDNVHSDDGGLLAVPVTDTVKKVNANHRVDVSIDRDSLWLAQTPQFFKLGLLEHALNRALSDHAPITDEASAMEYEGYHPKVIRGTFDNIKVTTPDDLVLASFYLHQRAAVGKPS